MTSIKPPDSGAPTAPHLSTPGATVGSSERSSTGAAGASFREALGQAQAQAVAGQTGVAPAAGSGSSQAADPIAALSQQVKSGQLSMDQAIDQLVERAADGVGRHLSAAQRDELRDVVRQALSFDPTLSALRSEG